ncbi:hypothetical protein EKD02_09425 [Chlorobium phaeovibrioides]|uniref:C-methyltransferase domain-containing protein n=1 Tax=Chlorobium phaeovibrioides TaxID=1094 RepID=A0A3S0NYC0_CHLPH|nr:methyltransferase C-terminal domain-containing protein [Chlorobium phaeovibrioides]RTY35180.1 hypothetical protein EKD02_09425 [Chlorobium phaeovibrioides]
MGNAGTTPSYLFNHAFPLTSAESPFSVKPVKKIFERYGLELAAVERVDTKGGSLRYYVQRPGGPVPHDGSVAALLHEEDLMGLYEKETYDEYSDKINALRDQLVAFLKRAKDEGKTIAGFGASITCTTLIYHFGIGGYLDYLVDDNPAKQGLYSPGHHIPVYPSRAIYERKPDIVLLLAWRFGDRFIEKNRAYLACGGCFIRPVPYFDVVGS